MKERVLLLTLAVAAIFAVANGRALNSLSANARALQAVRVGESNVPVKTADGYTLSGGLKVTNAQLERFKAAMAAKVLEADYTYWHWTTWRTCVRRAAKGVDAGEMNFLVDHDAGMKSGGGLYLARDPLATKDYGPCALEVTLKKGTLIYTRDAMNAAGLNIQTLQQKAGLGTLVPFVDRYDFDMNWWVTHNIDNIKSIDIGFKTWPSIPWWEPYARMAYRLRPTAVPLIQLFDSIDGPGGIQETITKEMSMGPGSNGYDSLSWLKSFYILMQYIDGPSLVRAIRVFSNPWDAFEPENFGGYMKAWMGFINARLAARDGSPISVEGYHYGTATKGNLGEGTSADAWAARQRDEAVPNLCKLASGGRGQCTYRYDVVRAGGDEEGRTFRATPSQVKAMQANPYLVVNALAVPGGDYLVYYYYPDPTHLNPALKTKVSPALWTAMANANYTSSPDLLKQHGTQLISELMLEMFKRHFGASVDIRQQAPNGLSLILDMVSIHPFTDFNGRTTRFYLVAAQFESAFADEKRSWSYGDAPASFISDFDIVTDISKYQKQVSLATTAYNNLRGSMLGEWIRGLKTGMAKHFDLPAWDDFVNEALVWARGPNASAANLIKFDAGDWPLIEKRQFVQLLDRKLGSSRSER